MLGISYDPKVVSFMRSIGQPCLELTELDQIAARFENLLANREAVRTELAAAGKRFYNHAKQNFGLFFEEFGIVA
jgi:polysaccharide pyruvyl transferase WcaK-like protein